MDGIDGLDDDGLDIPLGDEDSGSAYEGPSSDAAQSSSEDERIYVSRPPSTTPRRERGRSRSSRPISGSTGRRESSRRESSSPGTKEARRAESHQWSATFQEPGSAEIIKSPRRTSAGSRAKRKAEQPSSELRAKRLRGTYNDDYRQLLNSVIHETVLRVIPHEYPVIPGSQIGSSVWTEDEKDVFFSALSRLGRHDSKGIALRIGTKSQLEVQEYTQLLHQGLKDRPDLHQFDPTELHAAFEISDECDDLLERAGDAVASRQELAEIKSEKEKYGELWLLTSDIATDLEKETKNLGEQSIAKKLPAANFLDVKNWLKLSQQIFMNSGDLQGENNWNSLVEPGETPAIRATALEDFHRLAVSITKRLISAALFCAMSRRKATNAMGIKIPEIHPNDVAAAVKIVGLAENSLEFWIGSARRHSLNVFDDEDSGSDVDLTYDEVEAELKLTRRRSRSRSRSMSLLPSSRRTTASAGAGTDRETVADSTAESVDTDDHPQYDEEVSSLSSSDLENEELIDLSDDNSRKTRAEQARAKKIEDMNNARRAQDAYLEAYDHEASQMEEKRLRKLLRHASPTDIKVEPLEPPDPLKQTRLGPERADWGDNIEYWSPWETLETPVPEENFARNRKRMSRRARRRIREESSALDLSDGDEESLAVQQTVEEIDAIPSVEQVEDMAPVDSADVGMEDRTNDLYSASQSENESSPVQWQMSDDPFGPLLPQRSQRALSEEDITIKSDYED